MTLFHVSKRGTCNPEIRVKLKPLLTPLVKHFIKVFNIIINVFRVNEMKRSSLNEIFHSNYLLCYTNTNVTWIPKYWPILVNLVIADVLAPMGQCLSLRICANWEVIWHIAHISPTFVSYIYTGQPVYLSYILLYIRPLSSEQVSVAVWIKLYWLPLISLVNDGY